MFEMLLPVLLLIALALAFDFINGFHDAANSISTVVATKTLTPRNAIILACLFNVVGLFIFHLGIAATIAKGMVLPSAVDLYVIAAGLIGAIVWNLITWYKGLPSSSSHALIGGVVGAVIAKAGFDAVIIEGITKIAAFIVLSPLIGMILSIIIGFIIAKALPKIAPDSKVYRYGQIVSSSLYSIGHGSNDAQKTAGVIFLILVAGGFLPATATVPYWVAVVSFIVMGLGTLAGGWKIIKTMGYKITDLKPRGGFAAETGGSIMLFLSSFLGIPVSTTHTITGAIVGVGVTENAGKIKWKTLRRIFIGWLATIPVSAIIAASVYVLLITL